MSLFVKMQQKSRSNLGKVTATAVLLMGLAWAEPAEAFELPIPVDKAAHFAVSYVLTDQLIRMGATPEQALGAILVLGLVKELTDTPFDPADMAANTAGALAAAYVRVQLKF